MIRRRQTISSADAVDANHYNETETLFRLKVIYQTQLKWLRIEIYRLEIKKNTLSYSSDKQEKIERVIQNALRLEEWAASLKETGSVTEIAYCAHVLEAAARAMDNPTDKHICLLRFSVSTRCVESERHNEAPNLLRKSVSSSNLKESSSIKKSQSIPSFMKLASSSAQNEPEHCSYISNYLSSPQGQALKKIIFYLVQAILLAATIILAIKSLGISTLIQYGCGGGIGIAYFSYKITVNRSSFFHSNPPPLSKKPSDYISDLADTLEPVQKVLKK